MERPNFVNVKFSYKINLLKMNLIFKHININ